MLTVWMNALLSGFLLGWNYASPVPPLSEAQEAHFARIFRWDATASRPIPPVSQAVMNCDIKRLQELRAQGAYIRLQHEVQRANFYGQVECVEWLLTQGATLRPEEYSYAIMNGHLDMVRWWHRSPWFLRYSIQEENPFADGWRLELALESGNLELVRYLLDRGEALPTDPEQIAEVRRGIIAGGHWQVWQWLIQEQGWSFKKPDRSFDHAFELALLAGDFERVQGMLNMGYSIAHLKDKSHLLLYAARGGSLPAVRWLLAQGIPLTPPEAKYTYMNEEVVGPYRQSSNKMGGPVHGFAVGASSHVPFSWVRIEPTALEEAQAQGHLALARWLIKQGAVPLSGQVSQAELRVDQPVLNSGDTLAIHSVFLAPQALGTLIEGYYSEAVAEHLQTTSYQVLNDYVAPAGFPNSFRSLFDLAVSMENLPLVQYMLLRYPELLSATRSDELSSSALHLAAELGSIEMTQFLLEQGADPLLVNYQGYTPADVAEELYSPAVTRLLRQAEPRAKILSETLTEVSGQ